MSFFTCCKTFKEFLSEPDTEEFKVIKNKNYYMLRFNLNITYEDLDFSKQTTMAIKYCPWCGKKL